MGNCQRNKQNYQELKTLFPNLSEEQISNYLQDYNQLLLEIEKSQRYLGLTKDIFVKYCSKLGISDENAEKQFQRFCSENSSEHLKSHDFIKFKSHFEVITNQVETTFKTWCSNLDEGMSKEELFVALQRLDFVKSKEESEIVFNTIKENKKGNITKKEWCYINVNHGGLRQFVDVAIINDALNIGEDEWIFVC
ncbi:calmodulin [Anaeramoeba ignava]|uniref:Calmodulin n=1 Tax=Anaeramoeba ignava TaxID=1746090 RepID=A0A9Q0RF98_ANAIG|nr:calmodulin [Anaeramoeba ignava]